MALTEKDKENLIQASATTMVEKTPSLIPQILIVDDDPFARELIRRVLSKEDYETTMADGVTKALEILEKFEFDLIISDIVMPDGNGMDLLNHTKFKYPETEILLLTGTPDLSQAVKAMKEGALDYITKPYTPDKLLNAAKDALLKVQNKRKGAERIKLPQKYELVGMLGEGSMGTVFLVKCEGVEYALKVLKSYPNDPNSAIHMKRFFREEKILSKTDHPHIVKIYDSGITDDRMPFIVMECLKGNTLKPYIDNGTMNLQQKLKVISDMAEALSVLHKEDIIHRDIKPENIFILENMEAKLTDFGISYMKDSTLTNANMLCGSPGYIAPEYLKNEGFFPCSDIFSLGVVAYELLSGKQPYPGESLEQIIQSIINRPPEPLNELTPELPKKIADIIMQMIEQDHKKRLNNAAKIANKIRKLMNSKPSSWF
jgi:CheY-like chemotaxis protein